MALKLKKPAAGTAVVTKTSSHKGEVTQEDTNTEVVPPKEDTTQEASLPFGEVGVEASYTMNLGNYNSMRFSVSLKLPAQPNEINKVFDYAKSWADERLTQAVTEAQQS